MTEQSNQQTHKELHAFAFTYIIPMYNEELIQEAESEEKRISFQEKLEEILMKDSEYKINFEKHLWIVTFYYEDNDFALFVTTKQTFFTYNLLNIQKANTLYLYY